MAGSLNPLNPGTFAPARLSAAVGDEVWQQSGGKSPGQPEGSAYDWAHNGYPVSTVSDLDTRRPNLLQLLGKQIAVWCNEATREWHAVADRCPHR